MSIVEIVVLTIGISLESFAVMTCKGAMFPKIKKTRALGLGVLFGGWQALMLFVGNYSTTFYLNSIGIDVSSNSIYTMIGTFAGVIFFSLGLHMLWKALNNKFIQEKREEYINMKEIIILAAITGIDAFLIGVGLAFLRTDLLNTIIPIILVNILFVILGIYTGYHHGYEQKTKAYTVGGAMLVGIGVEVLVKHILI